MKHHQGMKRIDEFDNSDSNNDLAYHTNHRCLIYNMNPIHVNCELPLVTMEPSLGSDMRFKK
jgi:hypothetical protein